MTKHYRRKGGIGSTELDRIALEEIEGEPDLADKIAFHSSKLFTPFIVTVIFLITVATFSVIGFIIADYTFGAENVTYFIANLF